MKRLISAATVALALAAGPVAGAGERVSELQAGVKGESVAEPTVTETWERAIASLDPDKAIIPMAAASIIIEVNSTDRDAGFQVSLDSEGWRDVRVFGPNGREIARSTVSGGIRRIGGGTELFLESEEPEYEDLAGLQELIALLPAGEYRFLARLTDGNYAIGRAELSHVIPAGPELTRPLPTPSLDCASLSRGDTVIGWEPVTTTIQGTSRDLTIVAYQIIVEDKERGLGLNMTVDARATEISMPAEFLRPRTEYSLEVLAIEQGGNQTITESCFVTE